MFHEIGTTKQFPYSTRQVSKSWHTSNGDFQTKRKGNLQLNFCQYFNNTRECLLEKPDIVECKYNGKKLKKPLFNLILGTEI